MSTHNLGFLADIIKIMFTPVNPSFTISKWGKKGSRLYSHVFMMCRDWKWELRPVLLKLSHKLSSL